MKNSNLNIFSLWIIIAMVFLNISLATIVQLLKVPIYLDAVGTICAVLLIGWRGGAIVGILSFTFMTISGFGPYHIYFSGTQVAIASFIYVMAYNKLFKSVLTVLLTGVLLGLIAAIVSAPVIVFLFGGVEGNGAGLITAFLIKTGHTIIQSVLLKGLSIEPFDKTIQCLIAYYLIKSQSVTRLKQIGSTLIEKNFLS
ncbi:MAG: hypothetical protein POELPBGB_02951 [Bacteroidia bacterium]|nr:hypothetical protein [Bacteroidia bacterium]